MNEAKPALKRHWLKSDWVVIPCMLVLLLAGRSSLADHYHVPSGSMEHTIMTGDRVMIDKTAYGLRIPFTSIEIVDRDSPQRGDVAVFDSPVDGTRLIKRVAAVAGDTVSLHGGLLEINGRLLAVDANDESVLELFDEHRAQLRLDSGGGPAIDNLRIPDGYVLALGDNRGNSTDSRYFGLVEADALYGRALGVYFRRSEGLTWHEL